MNTNLLKLIRRTSMVILGIIIATGEASEYLVIRQDEKARDMHRLDSLNLLCYVIILITIVCTVWLFKHKRVRFIHDFLHETGLAIIYGLIFGAIIRYGGSDPKFTQLSVVPKDSQGFNMTHGPPDMLWIDFTVPAPKFHVPFTNYDVTFSNYSIGTNNTLQRSYAYVFRGELFNPDTDSKVPANKRFSEKATFDPEIFFNLILPVIVFNAGYSLKKKSFFRNIGAIMVYAFIGTLISCFVVGIILFFSSYFMPITMKDFKFSDCLFFGAIISATDPVTVLAIFTDLRVDVTLNALVFGESIFNDVISIVLATLIEKFHEHLQSGLFLAITQTINFFFSIFVFSFLQGSLIGCITAMLTKHTALYDYPLLESSLFLLMSYASFLLAEVLELSGIVSVLFCGICQAHYTYNNLSQESRVRTKSLFAIASFIAENFIFAYIGVSIFTFPQHIWSVGFIFMSIIAIIIGRALNIYPLSYLVNLGRTNKIPIEFQHIQFFSGLRGAMAFALAIRNTVTVQRRLMLTATSIISLSSVVFCGSTIQPMMNYFQIATNVDDSTSDEFNGSGGGFKGIGRRGRTGSQSSELISPADDISVAQSHTLEPSNKSNYEKAWLIRKWHSFDVNFMKPLLTHSQPSLMETMPSFCLPLSRILTSGKQMMGNTGSSNQTEEQQKMDMHVMGVSTRRDEQDFHHQDEIKPIAASSKSRNNHPHYSTSTNNNVNGDGPNQMRILKPTTATTSVAEITPTILTDNNYGNQDTGTTSTKPPETPFVLSAEPLLKLHEFHPKHS